MYQCNHISSTTALYTIKIEVTFTCKCSMNLNTISAFLHILTIFYLVYTCYGKQTLSFINLSTCIGIQ